MLLINFNISRILTHVCLCEFVSFCKQYLRQIETTTELAKTCTKLATKSREKRVTVRASSWKQLLLKSWQNLWIILVKSSFLVRLEAVATLQKMNLFTGIFSNLYFEVYIGKWHSVKTHIIKEPVLHCKKLTWLYMIQVFTERYSQTDITNYALSSLIFLKLGTTNFKGHRWLVPKVLISLYVKT